MTVVDTIDLNAAPDFILRDGGQLIFHTVDNFGGGTTPRSILDIAARILTESVDLGLAMDDMTGQQQRNTAEALNTISGMLRAYAGDFRAAGEANFY
ncbi:hypothetical protein [Shinella sp.]|jgi:hypothetical protein|uniref:hypothetical protein n=1 Tax=Shinella sp. TaxID=1870904 RepID=UPI003F6F0C22